MDQRVAHRLELRDLLMKYKVKRPAIGKCGVPPFLDFAAIR